MDFERYTGPQKISATAQLLSQCPHLADSPDRITDLIPGSDAHEAEKLHKFGLVKVVSDELAARLPHMTTEYPPYGLPELYRTPDMDEPGYRPLRKLQIKPINNALPIHSAFTALMDAYTSKMRVHMGGELKKMQEEPDFAHILAGLAQHGEQIAYGKPVSAIENVYETIGRPANDNLDILFGLISIVPLVLEGHLNRPPTHDETIAVLKKSRRLAILPSLLARNQLMPFLIASSKENRAALKPWGIDFDPEQFTTFTSKHDGTLGIGYKGGVEGLTVPSYETSYGEFGEAYTPTVTVKSSQPTRQLGKINTNRQVLACPSRTLITAMHKDIVEISDRERLFETR